jgi:hypothetical protein
MVIKPSKANRIYSHKATAIKLFPDVISVELPLQLSLKLGHYQPIA